MKISKYNASGNDFIIFANNETSDKSDLAKVLCTQKSGVGADGMIVIKKHKEFDFEWEFYNSDGSSAKMCGNGSRAAAMFAYENGFANEKMRFLSEAGVVDCQIIRKISKYKFSVKTSLTQILKLSEPFVEFEKEWFFYDTGVPHLLCFTEDLNEFNLELARDLREKYNANINFAKLEDGKLRVRTYERGVENETLACGTGMSACFYVLVNKFGANKTLEVIPKSGEVLKFELDDERVKFKGVVHHTFDADLFL